MSKFKVGDKIKYVGHNTSMSPVTATVASIPNTSNIFSIEGTARRYSTKHWELVKTTTPHKHAALIHAWADGAVIECIVMRGTSTQWIRCDTPCWQGTVAAYRIKPEKSEAELEKEAIILEMGALRIRLSKLEV